MCGQDIRARGLKAQVSSLDDFDFEELPNQKIATWTVKLWRCHPAVLSGCEHWNMIQLSQVHPEPGGIKLKEISTSIESKSRHKHKHRIS